MKLSPFTAVLFGLEKQIHIYYLGYNRYGSRDYENDHTQTISKIIDSVIPSWLMANAAYIHFIAEQPYNDRRRVIYNLPVWVDELYYSLPLMENQEYQYQLRMAQVGDTGYKDYYVYWREDFGLYRTT